MEVNVKIWLMEWDIEVDDERSEWKIRGRFFNME